MLQTMDDSELIRCYRLDRAGIMFVTDLIRDALTSLTQRRNAIAPEMKVITTLLSQPSVSRVITQTITALSEPLIVSQFMSFPLDIPTLQA